MLKVNEIFGPTIQGEGVSTGRRCYFIRLNQCNLHCTWCDTPYTWAFTEEKAKHHNTQEVHFKADEETELHVEEIVSKLAEEGLFEFPDTLVVISGGEPMLQQKELYPLLKELRRAGCPVEIETAGTIAPNPELPLGVKFNVSPKLSHSGNERRIAIRTKTLGIFNMLGANFKFVCQQPSDLKEVDDLVRELSIPVQRVWIMPEGISEDEVQTHALGLVEHVMERGYNLTMRVHVAIWGAKRGV